MTTRSLPLQLEMLAFSFHPFSFISILPVHQWTFQYLAWRYRKTQQLLHVLLWSAFFVDFLCCQNCHQTFAFRFNLNNQYLYLIQRSSRQPLLNNFITTFRSKTTKFYYHTDKHAIERVVAYLEVCTVQSKHQKLFWYTLMLCCTEIVMCACIRFSPMLY